MLLHVVVRPRNRKKDLVRGKEVGVFVVGRSVGAGNYGRTRVNAAGWFRLVSWQINIIIVYTAKAVELRKVCSRKTTVTPKSVVKP